MTNLPAISVIIPMYNTEKYIGECLNSILNQTFKNFEVIVVDDCSTDNSTAIVESYVEKFGGRLNLMRMKKNSGCAPKPRNKGLTISCGEYVFFMDADDMLVPTALEEMYTSAKDFNADVVYCEKFFKSNAEGENLELKNSRGSRHVKKPSLEPENLKERLDYILRRNFLGTPWLKLVNRKLLIENEIFFQRVRPCDDHLWTYGLFFFAKRFLRIPNAVYIWRMSEDSATRAKRKPLQKMNRWLESALLGLKWLDQIMEELDFFNQNRDYRYNILEQFTLHMFRLSFQSSLKSSQHDIYESIKGEFGAKFGDYDVLIPLLCTIINKYQKDIEQNNTQIIELKK